MRCPGRNGKYNDLYQAENSFLLEFRKPNPVYIIREHLLDVFLYHCGEDITAEKKREDPDDGYISQCQRRIDKYAPVHEKLKKKISEALPGHEDELEFRKQLDEIHKSLGL